ncbi:MAG: ABC transporter permease [Geminicoccaceae bacterium]|jgi:peptide/nickel transport system permease protein|nr:ABC transporter permease [Geminicoccaceae bacterium]MCB9966144.1 ABC transporter permease [Geminicoccaceae bacterium]HRY23137.1 ABC transporter permease [Geminicoccaceae bacterium]
MAASIDEPAAIAATAVAATPGRRMWLATWSQTEFKIGLVLFLLLVGTAFIYPLLSDIDPTKLSVRERFLPPVFLEGGTWAHPLGTDQLGRDLFVRSLVGLQNALMISVAVVVLMFAFGATVGLVAGYRGGWIDTILMRLTDAQLSIPLIILAIIILTVSRPTPFSVIVVLALAGWPVYARVTRSVTLAERRREYVRGAKILGASDSRIMWLLIAPNILPPIAFVAVLDIARMMIFEAILGFIGIGIQPPTPTFGTIIADGRKYLINAWWIATMPGGFLFLTLLSVNLMGAALERARNRLLRGTI